MEAKTQRILKNGWQFDHLFPKALSIETTIKRDAMVEDTVKFIPQVIWHTRWQIKKFVDQELKNLSVTQACEKLWHFVKDHIAYKKDETGKEQVRSPRRLWKDRIGDCDCFTVFLSACITGANSILSSVKSLMLRITKYSQDHFQHIYPVIITPDGKEIIMDCVVEQYNFEEPYTEKKDYPMELNYLDGVPMKNNPDAQMNEEGEELGKLFDFLKKKPATTTTSEPKKESKIKTILKKTVNVVNKVNPATVLLRAGVLASLKLNIMKVSQRLKYAYLSEAEAKKRGMDMAKFQKLKQVKDKIEKIYYGAGGDPKNFKAAVLTGKGNEKKEVPVSGLGSLGLDSAKSMTTSTPLTQVIGQEMYYSEFMDGTQEIEGLGSLGEPATATAIASASGVMAAIASLLKNLGNLFPAKSKEAADFENTADASAEAEKIAASGETDLDKLSEELQDENLQTKSLTTGDGTETSEEGSGENTGAEETWWQSNKKWLKPTLWVTGAASAIGIGYLVLKPKKGAKKKDKPLEGVAKKSRKPKRKKKATSKKIKTIHLK